MKKNGYSISLFFVMILISTSILSQTISYPVSAAPISVSSDSTLLTVEVSGASVNPTVCTTGFSCSILKYNANLIGHANLINLSGATGSSCNNITSGFASFTSLLNGSQGRQYFLYEYRPIVKTDSIIYTIPAGWKYVAQAATNYSYTTKSGSYSTFPATLTPVVTGSTANGYTLKYDVNAAYNNGTYPFVGTEGLTYNGSILFSPGCSTPDSATITVKEYGHFISYPSKQNPAAYVNSNTSVKAITYSGSSKPGVVIANNTGVIEAANKNNNYRDVQITGTNFNAARYVWLATEKLTGSGIDVVKVEYPVGTVLPVAATYGTNKNLYNLASTATTGLVNPDYVIVRVYFSKTGCGADSLKVRTGCDCNCFATSADNGCSQDLFLKANPALSEIQLLKVVDINNSGNLAAPAATYIAKIYCGSNASGAMPHSFYSKAINIGSTVTHTGSFMLNVPAEGFSGSPFFIQIQDTLSNSTKACLCGKPQGSVSGRVLQVKLESFTAFTKGSMVQFNWVVSEAINVSQYEIEFSKDAINFTGIGSVKAISNRYYSMLHEVPGIDHGYYRLKTVDEDGKFNYSETRNLKFGKVSPISIYPNHAKDVLKITLAANMLGKPVNISLITMDGKVVATLKVRAANRTEVMNVSKLANGKYQIIITTDTEVINNIIDVIR